jgi:hypothetical protein
VILGLPELFLLFGFLLLPFVIVLITFVSFGRRAKRLGYQSTRAYLRAIPRSDQERRDAADVAVGGLALCMLGLLIAPIVLVGIVPLFYGARKLAYASLGLGLVDDAGPRA